MKQQPRLELTLFATNARETSCFKEDWMHTTDSSFFFGGGGSEFWGNLFWLLLPPKQGPNNKQDQVHALFVDI